MLTPQSPKDIMHQQGSGQESARRGKGLRKGLEFTVPEGGTGVGCDNLEEQGRRRGEEAEKISWLPLASWVSIVPQVLGDTSEGSCATHSSLAGTRSREQPAKGAGGGSFCLSKGMQSVPAAEARWQKTQDAGWRRAGRDAGYTDSISSQDGETCVLLSPFQTWSHFTMNV